MDLVLTEFHHLLIQLEGSQVRPETKVDLSKDDLIDRHVRPYLQGEAFRMNGRTVQPREVARVLIKATDECYEEMRLKVLAEWEDDRRKHGTIHFGSPGWEDITRLGRDLTDEILNEVEAELIASEDQATGALTELNVPESWVNLLRSMVEAIHANVGKDRRPFLLSRTMDGDSLIHSGLAGGELAIYIGDLAVLQQGGYVFALSGAEYDVTPEGMAYLSQSTQANDTKRESRRAGSVVVQGVDAGTGVDSLFIVHGHDARVYKVEQAVSRMTGREAITLKNSGGYSSTIIEIFEEQANESSFAIVLLTGDDEGRKRGTETWQLRARQNVVFELGYFFGTLGRRRVVVLTESSIEQPSDIVGIRYIKFDDGNGWKAELGKALRLAGISADLNKL